MTLVTTRGLIVIEGLHSARASISEVILQTSLDRSRENGKRCNFINKVCYLNLRCMVVSVALYLRCEYVPLPLVGAPVRRVHLDRDSSLNNNRFRKQIRSSSGDTHSGGGVRAHGPHVEVDVVPGVVAAKVSCLVPEVISDHGLSLVRILSYLVVLPAEWVRVT